MRANVENCPYLLQSATRDPTTGIQTPSAEVEAEQAVAPAQDGPRQVPPEAAADEAAPAEAAGGERQPPRPRLPPPPRSDGDAAADPSARKENLKRKEGREDEGSTMDDIKREQNNATSAWKRASIFPKFELNSSASVIVARA